MAAASSPRWPAAVIIAIVAGAALLHGLSYWPGIMTWDAINQYGQATTGVFDDWHPPVMAWLWRRLIPLKAGPAPMFALQFALYWLGYGLIGRGALRRGQRLAAALVAGCALMPFPLAIMGSVLKDCLMEGLLLCAVGLALRGDRPASRGARLGAAVLLLLASLLRFNAFLATLPLLIHLLPPAGKRTPLRTIVAALVLLPVLLAAMPAANRLIGADKSDVALSLMIFDLGGITKHSGVNMFPDIGVRDPVAVNARCYRAEKWDSYSPWADPLCPIGFDRIDAVMQDSGAQPYATLLRAALAHPLAYAEHRFAHFNINTRFLVPDEVQGAAPDRDVPNEWHFAVARNPGLRSIAALAELSVHSPLGWPIWWIALAGGLLALCPLLPSRALVTPLALSGLLYGLGYLPFSVSSELRYHLWTITSVAIAAAFAAADLARGTAVGRARFAAALAPVALVTILCTLSRLG